jgi:hypothetical protein
MKQKGTKLRSLAAKVTTFYTAVADIFLFLVWHFFISHFWGLEFWSGSQDFKNSCTADVK